MNNSVDPQPVDVGQVPPGDAKATEAGLRALWESARRAAEAITRLREEKRELQLTIERLEKELQQLRQAVAEYRHHGAGQSGSTLGAGGERDQLAAKVKELIARLDAYL
ncbi:MAG: hypothetical protein AB1428_11050 [Bacteroidota bacterium]